MKNNLKKINIILMAVLFFSTFLNVKNINIHAATNRKGYAVYRDGVSSGGAGLNDHAALMYESTTNGKTKPIIHAPGGSKTVQLDTWDSFMDKKNFLGVFSPKNCTITTTLGNSFVAKGRELIGKKYCLLDQIDYHSGTNKVESSQVTHIRCDGLIEYIYEYYGYKVGGSSTTWDITKNTSANKSAHSLNKITPRLQNQSLLNKDSVEKP